MKPRQQRTSQPYPYRLEAKGAWRPSIGHLCSKPDDRLRQIRNNGAKEAACDVVYTPFGKFCAIVTTRKLRFAAVFGCEPACTARYGMAPLRWRGQK